MSNPIQIAAMMAQYAKERRNLIDRRMSSRTGFIDRDYPHGCYDYSTDDANNSEYQQGLWARGMV
jgi:hypothetical protein